VLLLTAANAALNHWVLRNLPAGPGDKPPVLLSMKPDDNLLATVGTQFPILVAIFATMSLLLAERDSGTLAWTVSKPASRMSVLLSKWLTTTAILWVTSIVLPLAATVALIAALYGLPTLGSAIAIAAGLGAATAFYVALSLAAATVIPSQAGVAAVGLAVFIVPPLIVGIVPDAGAWLPTSIYGWVVAGAFGAPVPLVTPIAVVVGVAVLLLLGRSRFEAMEL
jgi:ABC-2 type transport system permease protein